MESHETLGVVFWNTWYRAAPDAQLAHVEKLDELLRYQGAAKVILCLSEASSTTDRSQPGLLQCLQSAGYDPLYAPVSYVRDKKLHEGLVVASKDIDFTADPITRANFDNPLRYQRGIASRKLRQATKVRVGSTEVVSAHLSYLSPHQKEIDGLLDVTKQSARYDTSKKAQIIGGDFNTVSSKRIVDDFEEAGFVKLHDPERTTTVPLKRGSRYGFELDHVFVTSNLAETANLHIADQGPSNHNPLLVRV